MAVNLPYQTNAATVQGPGPTGQEGFPVGVVPVPNSGSFLVDLDGVVSAGNSTDTPLLAGQDFTGTWDNILDYASVTVFAIADQRTRVADGCHLQFSTDGVTVMDDFLIPYRGIQVVIPAELQVMRASLPKLAKFFRVLYRNSESTAQTLFHLQTTYHPTKQQDGLILQNGYVQIDGAQRRVTSTLIDTTAASTTVVGGLGNTKLRVLALVLTASATANINLFSGTPVLPNTIIDPRSPLVLNLLPFGQVGVDGSLGQAMLLRQNTPLAHLTGWMLTARI